MAERGRVRNKGSAIPGPYHQRILQTMHATSRAPAMHQTVIDAFGCADIVASMFRGGLGERLNMNRTLGALQAKAATEKLTIAE